MLNKVMLIGHLGSDPDVRYMSSGESVATVSIATNRSWKDRQTGESREATEWHRVVFFNVGGYKLAEIVAQYLKKGSLVYIEGRLQTRKWQDKEGKDNYTTEIVADNMRMLGGRGPTATSTTTSNYQPTYAPQAAPSPSYTPAPQSPYPEHPPANYATNQAAGSAPAAKPVSPPAPAPAYTSYDDFDNDVPF